MKTRGCASIEWDYEPIRTKREQREREKEHAPELAGDLDSLLQVFGELYGETIHYALELIQNADDAEAESMRFIFEPDRLIVTNDGNPFSPKDLDAIMRVAVRHKRKKIGFFGIGFKSVFNITNEPQIISGHYNFTLRDFIYPREVSDLPVDPKLFSSGSGAIFVLPYKDEQGTTFEELSQETIDLRDMVLLFLPSLQSIQITVSGRDSLNRYMRKKTGKGGYTKLSTKIGETTEESSWKVFRKDFHIPRRMRPNVKPDIERTEVVIAFRSPKEAMPDDMREEYVYCYLPTRKSSGLPFVVQADFLPTVGRGDLRDHDWNQLLLEKLGELAAQSILALRDDPNFGPLLYDLIPSLYEVADKHMRTLVNSMHKKISRMPIVRTLEGEWATPSKCVIGDDHIVDIITRSDLRFLFGRRLVFADPTLPQRARQVIAELGGRSISISDIVKVATKPTRIRNRSPTWFIHLYDYLASEFSEKTVREARINNDQEFLHLLEQLKSAKLLLIHPKGLASASEAKRGRLICYPQRTVKIEEVSRLFKDGRILFLHRDLQSAKTLGRKVKNERIEDAKRRIKPFLETNFNVQVYFTPFHVISKVILELFESGEYETYRHVDLYDFLDYIRRYLRSYQQKVRKDRPSVRDEDIFNDIKKRVRIRCQKVKGGKRIPSYELPIDVYFTRSYTLDSKMERLFGDVDGTAFLSAFYNSLERKRSKEGSLTTPRKVPSWREFFELIGVWSFPRVSVDDESTNITRWDRYKWIDKEYSTRGHYIKDDATAPEMLALIESFSSMTQKEVRKRAEILWHSLNRNWSYYRTFLDCNYEYHYWGWKEKKVETTFIRMLKRSRWVQTTSGKLVKPHEAFRRTKQNELLLGASVKYTEYLGGMTFLRDIGVRLRPEPQEVIRHLKMLRKAPKLVRQNLVRNCSAIYEYLAAKSEKETKGISVGGLQKEFKKMKLIYIPRRDKLWWGINEVFWHDYRGIFLDRREFLEGHYPKLREFFRALGVNEKPEMIDCLMMLRKLSEAKPRGKRAILERKEIIANLYKYMEGVFRADIEVDPSVLQFLRTAPIYMTRNDEFKSPSVVFFVDAGRYLEIFDDLPPAMWLPYSRSSVSKVLSEAGIRPVSDLIDIRRYIRGISEVETDSQERLMEILSFVLPYLSKTFPDLYDICPREKIEDSLNGLEIQSAKSITIVYGLKSPASVKNQVRKTTPVSYFDELKNILYIRADQDVFTLRIAREISYLFEPAHDATFTFLTNLMDSAHDYQSLQERINAHGLQEMVGFGAPRKEATYLVPSEEELKEPLTEEDLSKEEEDRGPKRKVPKKLKFKELFDLDSISEFVVREVLTSETDDRKPREKLTRIRLPKRRKGKYIPSPPKRTLSPRELTSWMAERLAYIYEEHEKRKPTHVPKPDQDAAGCDIVSPPRFIEVKGFIGEGDGFEMRPSQLKKAEEEKDDFFLYIVTNLEKGKKTMIHIIQNPIENPHFIYEIKGGYRVSDWKDSVCQEVEVKGKSRK